MNVEQQSNASHRILPGKSCVVTGKYSVAKRTPAVVNQRARQPHVHRGSSSCTGPSQVLCRSCRLSAKSQTAAMIHQRISVTGALAVCGTVRTLSDTAVLARVRGQADGGLRGLGLGRRVAA